MQCECQAACVGVVHRRLSRAEDWRGELARGTRTGCGAGGARGGELQLDLISAQGAAPSALRAVRPGSVVRGQRENTRALGVGSGGPLEPCAEGAGEQSAAAHLVAAPVHLKRFLAEARVFYR